MITNKIFNSTVMLGVLTKKLKFGGVVYKKAPVASVAEQVEINKQMKLEPSWLICGEN